MLQLSATDGLEGDESEQKLTKGKSDREKRVNVNVTARCQSGVTLVPLNPRCSIQT